VNNTTDIHKELIELSKKGDKRAQYKLYQYYSKAMLNLAYRMTGRVDEAEDILQDAFTSAFIQLPSFRFESSFGSWLKRIVINHCINMLNKQRVNVQSFDALSYFDKAEDTAPDIPDELLDVKNIHLALMKLPDGYRVVFNLYMIEGYDHSEISQILGISESTSKTQYMRARNKVRDLLLAHLNVKAVGF